jgi:hypothetical protein
VGLGAGEESARLEAVERLIRSQEPRQGRVAKDVAAGRVDAEERQPVARGLNRHQAREGGLVAQESGHALDGAAVEEDGERQVPAQLAMDAGRLWGSLKKA